MTPADRLAVLIATGFGSSAVPVRLYEALAGPAGLGARRWSGAGLVGSLLGWALLYALPEGGALLALSLAAGTAVAVWSAGAAERALGRHDDPRIVVDEVVGFWFAAALLPRRFGVLLAAFVLFRVFDAFKPPPLGRLEALPGGWGIVLDDAGAGAAANLLVRAALAGLS